MQAEDLTCLKVFRTEHPEERHNRHGQKSCRRSGCGRQFVAPYTYRRRGPAVRRIVVPLALNGRDMRDTARALQVSPATLLRLLRAQAARVRQPPAPRLVELALDEPRLFVGDKSRQSSLWYAFDPRQIVAWQIWRRTDWTCARRLGQLAGCQVLCFGTDEWNSYVKLIPEARH